MDIVGLEPRRTDLARGILIARSARPLDAATQKSLWAALAGAGVIEDESAAGRDDGGERGDDADDVEPEPDRSLHAAPWLPPATEDLAAQRRALEDLAGAFAIDAVWCIKIETGIDGVAWLELAAAESRDQAEDADPSEPAPSGEPDLDDASEILYAAPDAPGPAGTVGRELRRPEAEAQAEDDDDNGDDDDDDDPDDELELEDGDELEALPVESHWRNGAPPFEHTVSFPIERYPEIIDEYDIESFGIAVKLAGAPMLGEESVINAFFALWLSVYQDERADEFDAFQRADVVHDRDHRSTLMWVERFAVPATPSDQVHFLLWIVARLHEIVPVAWARFDTVDEAMKAHASEDDGTPFVLAGNPFAERFRRQSEEAALAWAVSQSAWSKRELAGMLVELALEHDPDNPTTALVAERLLRRALSFEPASDASGYLAIVHVRQHRIADAIAHAEIAPSRDVRMLVIGEIAEHAPTELLPALDLLDDETLDATSPEDLAELTATVARQAPAHLPALLARLPADASLVPHLYNASFSVDRPLALMILRRVLALPPPAREAGEARTALVMAWNNACIHAHGLGDYKLAIELADGGQPYADENPYIYHSAACAYAAVGQIDRALAQVALAIEHDYEHAEKMETDADLAPLQSDPRFAALFADWRGKRADLN